MLRLFACLLLTNVFTFNAERAATEHLADVETGALAAAEVSEKKIEEHVTAEAFDKVLKKVADHVTADKVVSKHSDEAASILKGCCAKSGESCGRRKSWKCYCKDGECERCSCV
ncbi:unnamed protein product [Effrenium voratum]|nr:unnamed protein product [Effrenium voratum]